MNLTNAESILLFDDPAVSVWCYPELKLIHHQMHGYCFNEPFRKALTAGSEAMREHRAIKWLSDDRNNGPLSPEDEQWAIHTWFPSTRARGWKYWALVMPEAVLGQLNVKRFVDIYAEKGVTTQMFSELEPATRWITQSAPSPIEGQ